MTDAYAEWLKAGNSRLSSVGNQSQQHGAGGVENPVLDAFRRRFARNREVSELTPLGFFEAGWSECGQEITRLQAQVAQLTEELAEWHAVHAGERELRQLVESHMDTARGEWSCVARCASLEAVVEAAKGIALRQSRTHQALRQASAALDQPATTTQEGTQ